MNDVVFLEYAGVVFPPTDEGGYGFSLEPIDKADRNGEGDLILEEVAIKRKVTCKWSYLDGEKTNLIFSTILANRSGTLKFYDPSQGSMAEMQAYYGAGAKIDMTRYEDDLKRHRYSAVSINFIEV